MPLPTRPPVPLIPTFPLCLSLSHLFLHSPSPPGKLRSRRARGRSAAPTWLCVPPLPPPPRPVSCLHPPKPSARGGPLTCTWGDGDATCPCWHCGRWVFPVSVHLHVSQDPHLSPQTSFQVSYPPARPAHPTPLPLDHCDLAGGGGQNAHGPDLFSPIWCSTYNVPSPSLMTSGLCPPPRVSDQPSSHPCPHSLGGWEAPRRMGLRPPGNNHRACSNTCQPRIPLFTQPGSGAGGLLTSRRPHNSRVCWV